MKRSRFSEEQIIAIVKDQEAGMATTDVYLGQVLVLVA
jgi:putative transposase